MSTPVHLLFNMFQLNYIHDIILFLNYRGELLHPVEICIFYRSNIQAQLSEYRSHAVPVNFFCRMKEVVRVISVFLVLYFHLALYHYFLKIIDHLDRWTFT